MKTLIVYESTGTILSTMMGSSVPAAAAVLVADVPDGYTVSGVDIETNTPVLQKNPPTLEERIAALEATEAALLGEE